MKIDWTHQLDSSSAKEYPAKVDVTT